MGSPRATCLRWSSTQIIHSCPCITELLSKKAASTLETRDRNSCRRGVQQSNRHWLSVHDVQDFLKGQIAGTLVPFVERPSSRRIQRRTIERRLGAKNMCSVRHKPIPCAPKFESLGSIRCCHYFELLLPEMMTAKGILLLPVPAHFGGILCIDKSDKPLPRIQPQEVRDMPSFRQRRAQMSQ